MQISASVASGDIGRLVESALAAQAAGADRIHVDIEDGVFIPSFTVGPRIVEVLRAAVRLPLDVHLQVQDPERWILPSVRGGADLVLFHPEATAYPLRVVELIREAGARAGAALALCTPVHVVLPYLDRLDAVLLLSCDPAPADAFHPSALDKGRELSRSGIEVQMDGGITPERVREMQAAGVKVAVAGRAVFGQGLEAVARSIETLKSGAAVS